MDLLHVHGHEGTSHPLQQRGSFVWFKFLAQKIQLGFLFDDNRNIKNHFKSFIHKEVLYKANQCTVLISFHVQKEYGNAFQPGALGPLQAET